ncbi:conserved unknown protein [Ectocarpus siliculosus]|uniref:Palmitoyltransferase n=1 Tax=Ectocarpus siliculosus TaxID=2880 RepID=D8LSG7_ECTSI|nr:conserved unknown protein [Ectocarpus siliculosus]|eukprot:CBN75224.1 conserved unknown protein [Ectocarpus siliculosus]
MAGFLVVMSINVLLLVLAIFLMFFADPESHGYGGQLYRLVCEGGPRMLSAGMRLVFGEACAGKVSECGNWVMNKPNRLMQGFYMVIVNCSFICFIFEGFPRLPNDVLPWPYHTATGYLVMAACIGSFVLACNVPPGSVRAPAAEGASNRRRRRAGEGGGAAAPGRNAGGGRHAGLYPHDGVVFVEGFCKTCQVAKPARSKHCRVCNVCVPRFDHHCAWLNQCVGEENYRIFLLFLIIHSSMLWYGTVLTYGILKSVVMKRKLLTARFYHKRSKTYVRGSYSVVLQYLMHHYGKLCGLLALSATMALVLTGFLSYHVYLLLKGTTTNESAKWGETGEGQPAAPASAPVDGDGGEGRGRGRGGGGGRGDVSDSDDDDADGGDIGVEGDGGVDGVGATAGAVDSSAAATGGTGMRRRGGRGRGEAAAEAEEAEAEAPAVPHPGPLPDNIYDNGMWANLMEVLFPRSLRKEGKGKALPHRDPFRLSYKPYWVPA